MEHETVKKFDIAPLDDQQLSRLNDLERELGVTLIAYVGDEKPSHN